jgi:hypothetical protein
MKTLAEFFLKHLQKKKIIDYEFCLNIFRNAADDGKQIFDDGGNCLNPQLSSTMQHVCYRNTKSRHGTFEFEI